MISFSNMYELMVVVNPSENADGFVKKLEGLIGEAKASGLKTERIGKKPLAYQIAKQTEGEYMLFTFEAPGDAPSAILSKLKLEQDAILRYMIIKSKVTYSVNKSKKSKVATAEDVEQNVEEIKKVTAKVEVKAKVLKAKKTSTKSVKVERKETKK